MTTTADAAPDAVSQSEACVLRYAEVVVDARTGKPDDTFTYSIPPHMRIGPGHLVLVPFGSRTLPGVVTSLLEEPNVDYTRPIASLVEEQPVLTPERIELGRWAARYYRASLFDALAPMLPPGMRGSARAYVQAAADPRPGVEERLSGGARRLFAYLRANPRPHRIAALTASLGPWVRNAVRALVEAGAASEWLSEPRHKPHASRKTWLVPEASASTLRQLADEQSRAQRRAELLRGLACSPAGLSAADARKRYGRAAVVRVIEDALASLQAAPSPTYATVTHTPLLPTPEQQRALAALKPAIDDPSLTPRTWLLHGATGSGKTEVYLQAIAHCLAKGQRAIALVPEVALTPQMTQRFEERFPGRVGLLHSRLTPARQRDEWWRIFRGERSVVIGPRSALFSPVKDLGLIVLDEEHEWTYKQSDAQPLYHARDVAEQLAKLTGAVVVLGSATPDVVTSWRAIEGTIGKLSMPGRIERSGAPTALAEVEVVDMRTELREGNRSIFSRLLQERLQDTLAAGRQAVLFLNRRGAASIVACRSCGSVMRCARCATPLTYHSALGGGRLRCHHCGRARTEPRRCPRCRSVHIRYLGLGTQRVADEVSRIAPHARVLRWDSDTASGTGAHERLLRAFADGKADVLVGTQMVAKGLDVPTVDLVGVVLADIGIHMPDFRAPERTFQLLTQVAGRAGRGPQPGYAVVQTYLPDHYAVQAAAGQDYAAFYAAEMEHRRAHANPPFSRLVRLLCDGHSDRRIALEEAQQLAGRLRRTVHEWDMRRVDVIGPAPTYPPRIRNAWRWQLLIRASEPRMLLDKVSIPPSWRVDVDPVNIV